jgi:heptosyltransferase-2
MARGLKKFELQRRLDDTIGAFFATLFFWKKQRELPKKIRRICVIKLSGIGDAILTLPMIKKLKEAGKEVFVIAAKENFVVYNQSFIDKIIVFDIKLTNPFKILKFINNVRKLNIDVAIDTSQTAYFSAMLSYLISKFCVGFSNPKTPKRNRIYDVTIQQNPSKHMVFNFLDLIKPLGFHYEPKKIHLLKLPFFKKDEERVRKLIENHKNLVGIHPCSVFDYREWPRENWAKIIEYLVKKYKVKIVIIGAKDEKPKVDKLIDLLNKEVKKEIIDAVGKLNLQEVFALMPKLKLFIANDGGPMHIAAAQGVSTIGLFGTDTPLRYAPFNKKSLAIYKNLPGHPCIKPYLKEFKPCGKCLKAIKVNEVKAAIKKLEKYLK